MDQSSAGMAWIYQAPENGFESIACDDRTEAIVSSGSRMFVRVVTHGGGTAGFSATISCDEEAGTCIQWQSLSADVTVDDDTCSATKITNAGWNAGAWSVETITWPLTTFRGVRFRVSSLGEELMVGTFTSILPLLVIDGVFLTDYLCLRRPRQRRG